MLTNGFTDNKYISVPNLKRQLARLPLYRGCNLSEPDIVVNYIADQLRGPGHPISMPKNLVRP